MPLPDFIPPMLATLGAEAFDSADFLFEPKWDGVRVLGRIDGDETTLRGRSKSDFTARFPELGFLRELPAGTALDGELVVLQDGRPDFHSVMGRVHARSELKIGALARTRPASFVAFDLLFQDGRSTQDLPLEERRARLAELVAACGNERLVFSDGVVESGVAFFEQLEALRLEGMVAKRLGTRYAPGERSEHWIKIKRRHELHCAIVGYVPEERGHGLRSLCIAAEFDGALESVGRVGSGLTLRWHERLWELLRTRATDVELVELGPGACPVEPGLFCVVSYLERTRGGGLRAPVFERLIQEP